MLENYAGTMPANPEAPESRIDPVAKESRKPEQKGGDVELPSYYQQHLDVELPEQKGVVRRVGSTSTYMHYHRLFVVVALVNVAYLLHGMGDGGWWSADGIALDSISNLVIANFFIGIVIRQHYVINFLFKLATFAPTSWPLSVRRVLGKVYHFGGLHSGCTVAGTVWFTIFVGSLTYQYAVNLPGVSGGTVAVTYELLIVLLLVASMAWPPFRARFHDSFEAMHRIGGWTALLLFWLQTILFIGDQKPGVSMVSALIGSTAFWLLVGITVSVILPWLRLRKVSIDIERPSPHVVLVRFNYGVTPFAGSSTAISRKPLLEWHSFANVPAPGEDGFRLTISRAGDWTGQFIDDMPSHIWVKGVPTAGVGNIDKLFKRVVWVATGSGIGPCLPHLLSMEVPARLIWATKNPRRTYGNKLVEDILDVQPDALIWDTDEYGKPDMVKLAYSAYKACNAEAVIVISNPKLTWQVVTGMESRGIPAYGAIWDS